LRKSGTKHVSVVLTNFSAIANQETASNLSTCEVQTKLNEVRGLIKAALKLCIDQRSRGFYFMFVERLEKFSRPT
jgi:hypothetical protein